MPAETPSHTGARNQDRHVMSMTTKSRRRLVRPSCWFSTGSTSARLIPSLSLQMTHESSSSDTPQRVHIHSLTHRCSVDPVRSIAFPPLRSGVCGAQIPIANPTPPAVSSIGGFRTPALARVRAALPVVEAGPASETLNKLRRTQPEHISSGLPPTGPCRGREPGDRIPLGENTPEPSNQIGAMHIGQ
jgi:hypothetical protein